MWIVGVKSQEARAKIIFCLDSWFWILGSWFSSWRAPRSSGQAFHSYAFKALGAGQVSVSILHVG